jgi:hypothetical protein
MRYTDATNREGALLHDGVADTLVSGEERCSRFRFHHGIGKGCLRPAQTDTNV